MDKQNKNTIISLLNSCEYKTVLSRCGSLHDADEVYFYALTLDQMASVNKMEKENFLHLLEKSLHIIQIGETRYPNDYRFKFLLGLNHLHAQRGERALQFFETLYKETKDLKYLLSVANAQKAIGLYEDALYNYQKIVDLGTSTLLTSHNIANTYSLMGDIEQAKTIAKQGLKIEPKNAFESQIIQDLEKLAKE